MFIACLFLRHFLKKEVQSMNYPNYYGNSLFGQNNGYMQPLQNNNMPLGQQQQQQNNLNWVQGEAGARAWLVAPSNTILLMDSEKERFYIKSADSSGMPSMRIFEYKEIGDQKPINHVNNVEYASKEDIVALNARIDALEHMEAPKIEKKRGRVSNDESTE